MNLNCGKKSTHFKKHRNCGTLREIESATIRGIPDVNCLINGSEFWIELKSKESKNLGLSNYQINWHIKHQKCGGKVFILLPSTKQRGFKLFSIVALDSRNHIISNHIRNHIPNHIRNHIISNHTIISNHIDKNQGIFRLILESRTLNNLFAQLEKLLKK
tara:strand:- start:27 stop:506 length:480 start_codon:yes stop_codon:yes gene_type:complete